MTVASTTNRKTFAGDNASTSFATSPVVFFVSADLSVYVTNNITGIATTLVENTHYTVSGGAGSTGTVSLAGGGSPWGALQTGTTLVLVRDVALTQETDFQNNDASDAETVETAFDRLTMIAQQLSTRIGRTLVLPDGDTSGAATTLPTPAAGKLLGWDDLGTALVNYAPVDALLRDTINLLGYGAVSSLPCEYRITLTSGAPWTAADVLAATTIYLAPAHGNRIGLFSGGMWAVFAPGQMSIAVPATTGTVYDLFCYNNNGVPTPELFAWTNDTTRVNDLVTQDGVVVKFGDATRRYVGSIRTTGVSGQCEDSFAKRYVWNYYNQALRPMRALEATDSWTYSTAAWQQANASAANQLDFIIGLNKSTVKASALHHAINSTTTPLPVSTGIGLDGTAAPATGSLVGRPYCTSLAVTMLTAKYNAIPGKGRHILTWLEYGASSDAQTWYGDAGASTVLQSGIEGEMLG